jgi:hypothetical protein
MIRGIGGKPYINLDPYIDIEGFTKLHYKICKGIVLSETKKEGNLLAPGIVEDINHLSFKPLFWVLREYDALPDDHEIKVIGRQIGSVKENRDKFVLYLKLAMGGYDPYQFIFLKTEAGPWVSRFDEKEWTPDSVHFPEVKQWMESLVENKVFKHLGRALFFKAEHDCKMMFHRDFLPPAEFDYFDHRHEFIHIRPNLDKPFYIWDTDTDEKIEMTSLASFFNDQDWHSGGVSNKQTYSLRIDGEFTDEFREKIGISHLNYY